MISKEQVGHHTSTSQPYTLIHPPWSIPAKPRTGLSVS